MRRDKTGRTPPDAARVRLEVLRALDAARRDAAARRAALEAAREAYERFLAERAIPIFRTVASVLKAEGLPFEVTMPRGSVRLVAEGHRENVVELEFDPDVDPPHVVLRTTWTRGSRTQRFERALAAVALDRVADEDLVRALMAELAPRLV